MFFFFLLIIERNYLFIILPIPLPLPLCSRHPISCGQFICSASSFVLISGYFANIASVLVFSLVFRVSSFVLLRSKKFFGRLTQLVQSGCLTSSKSEVRVLLCPQSLPILEGFFVLYMQPSSLERNV